MCLKNKHNPKPFSYPSRGVLVKTGTSYEYHQVLWSSRDMVIQFNTSPNQIQTSLKKQIV
jgi:hypothetical protein